MEGEKEIQVIKEKDRKRIDQYSRVKSIEIDSDEDIISW